MVAATLAAGGCRTRARPAGEARMVRDGLGHRVRLPAAPARLISLAPSSTEILFALGASARLVGRDHFSDWPPEARALPDVGANLQPSLERLLALRPDVVFIDTSANDQSTAAALERAGVAVFVSHAERVDEVYTQIAAIGEAVNATGAAADLVAAMRARVERVAESVAGQRRPRTLVVVWPEPLTVAGPRTFVDDLIGLAGGSNVAADSPKPYPSYSVERLLARAPEVIIVGTHAAGKPAAVFARYPTLPAVKSGRVFVVDGDLLFRPGPRLAEALEDLAPRLHPELAADGGAAP